MSGVVTKDVHKHPLRDEAIRLRTIEGLSYKEIGVALGMSKSTLSYILTAVTLSDEQKKRLSDKKAAGGAKGIQAIKVKPRSSWVRPTTRRVVRRKLQSKQCAYSRCGKPFMGYRGNRFCCRPCGLRHRVKELRRRFKRRAVALLGGRCSRCGYDRCYAALQFHHVGKKDFQISASNIRAWAKVKAEVMKCELLCANCHAEEHHRASVFAI